MKALTKKRIIIGTIVGGLTASIVYLVWKIKNLLKFDISFSKLKFRETSPKNISFDLGVNFKNTSDIEIILKKQQYDIYLNDVFITTIFANNEQVILPNNTSLINLKVNLNTVDILDKIKSLGDGSLSSLLKLLANIKKQNLKIVFNFGVKLGLLTFPLKFTESAKIEEWGAKSTE